MFPANQTRRTVMLMAWHSRREEPTRSFADCLRSAWRWVKGIAKEVAKTKARAARNGGLLKLADLTRSPIHSANKGKLHGGQRVYQAAYMTARLGY